MPSANPTVISIRGTEQYQKFLAKLLKRVRRDHPKITTFHHLGILGIQTLAHYYDLEAPPHAGPKGPRPKQSG